jgi:hypothetical protein
MTCAPRPRASAASAPGRCRAADDYGDMALSISMTKNVADAARPNNFVVARSLMQRKLTCKTNVVLTCRSGFVVGLEGRRTDPDPGRLDFLVAFSCTMYSSRRSPSKGLFHSHNFTNVSVSPHQSILMPASFTTFSHLLESFLISAVNSSPGSVITTSC